MPQGYGTPQQNTRPNPYRLRQDLGYIPARAMAEGDGGGGITSVGGPTAPILSLTPIAIGDCLANLAGANPDVPVPTPFVFLNLVDVPHSYTGKAGQFVQVNAGATGLQFGTITAASIVPLSTGDSPGSLVFGNRQFIGLPYSTLLDTELCPVYLAAGLFAARPVTPGVVAGASSGYLATDTGKFFLWSGVGWVQTN